jgi:Type IV secretion system pilin
MQRSKHWFNKSIIIFFLACIGFSSCAISTFAADACECFCGNQSEGAIDGGVSASPNDCAQFCQDVTDESGGSVFYVGCYADESLYPENSNLCWTESECSSYVIDNADTQYSGDWGGQNAYCSTQSITGAHMGYCYGPLIPVVLNVPILETTEVGSIGDYVNLVYTYAIPIAAIFGVLMFTFAGFQYMTAGGDKGAVTKAKGRLTNTVVGIVLLMSIYTIAYLIDPRLTWFNELRPPLVKEAVLVDDTTTCEALLRYGFDISPASGTCGEKGTISGDENIELNIANPPEVGDDCMFSGCDVGKSCAIKDDQTGGVCVMCDEVSEANTSLGVTPSSAICEGIATRAAAQSTNKDHYYSCYYDDDFALIAGDTAAGVDECVMLYTDGQDYIDCQALQDKAMDMEDGCRAYEHVNAISYGFVAEGIADFFTQGSADTIEDFQSTFAKLCESDRDTCQLADLGSTAQGSCQFVDMSVAFNLISDDYMCLGTKHILDIKQGFWLCFCNNQFFELASKVFHEGKTCATNSVGFYEFNLGNGRSGNREDFFYSIAIAFFANGEGFRKSCASCGKHQAFKDLHTLAFFAFCTNINDFFVNAENLACSNSRRFNSCVIFCLCHRRGFPKKEWANDSQKAKNRQARD